MRPLGALLRQLRREILKARPQLGELLWISPAIRRIHLQRWIVEAPQLSWWSGVQVLSLDRRGDQIRSAVMQRDGEPINVSFDVLVDGSELGDSLLLADIPIAWAGNPRSSGVSPALRCRATQRSLFGA